MGQTPEEKAKELDKSFEESKARAEAKEQPAKMPEKPSYGSGSATTDDQK